MESFAAVLTGIWSGVGVDEEVRGQSGRPLETFVAYFAAEDSFLPVKKVIKIFQVYKYGVINKCCGNARKDLLVNGQLYVAPG